ncbi:uncharacterized protein LOC129316778 [Prosopis cineraria]|uniref:uncharacterized protein LOC129316778 n=1 Tax=Prosopis cineraria TaxID=364024 RepID=UPI00241002CF|nr:uncharacterized protein LOC129316778 [Prosopis cineraria]
MAQHKTPQTLHSSSFPLSPLFMDLLPRFFIFAFFLLPIHGTSIALDSLRQSQFLRDNGTTLVSKDGTFQLGFFAPGPSTKRYLGIWYKNIPVQTVVWVANRLNPVNDSSVALTMTTSGDLVLSQNNTVLWSTNSTAKPQSPTARLLDSGNLVVIDENGADPDEYLWQSFDYPSDTLLPGMKYGWDLKTGRQWYLTAWKSPNDPSPGELTCAVVLYNYPDSYIMKGTQKFYRFGPWNGVRGSGGPEIKPNPVFQYTFVDNKDGYYYTDLINNNSVLTRLVLNETGSARYRYVWLESIKTWQVYSTKPIDYCDTYGLCGPNGNCIISDSPVCRCLKGFTPKSPEHWNSVDWTDGCVRNKPLNCSEKYKDGFIKLTGMKVPDTTLSWLDRTMNLEQCRRMCLENCSCTAYTNSDIRGGGSGCALWFGNLIDVRYYASGGQDLYVRMDASEFESENKKKLIMIVTISIGATLGMLLVGGCIIYRVSRNRKANSEDVKDDIQYDESPQDDLDLPLFDLATIANATSDFSKKNKLGEGGFGPVYWGKLLNGQEIAVKRLSIKSRQGLVEFKNEVKFIAKLQHRNLVKLLGCCIHGQEKMLVYEYMPNRSLNAFIFDKTKGELLDWSRRFHIIIGIGRGLMYLHQDSRLRIIHRDLKASNILLDDKFIPKISDFGLAKTFEGEQTEGNTNRVMGTYGYMAPEYAADGLYSIKSDVFSYGILVLEIICGKKNRGFYLEDFKHNLIGHAWILWNEGRVLELIDKNIDMCNVSEVLRCIHVSLLCVQQNPEDRPTIASAVVMLESEIELPKPKEPGFFHGQGSVQPHTSKSSPKECSSTNEVTITLLENQEVCGMKLKTNADINWVWAHGKLRTYQNFPVQTVVWVANGVNPINDSSAASLTLDTTGRLVLIQNDTVQWHSTSQKQVQNPVAELLDSGNLVHSRLSNPSEAWRTKSSFSLVALVLLFMALLPSFSVFVFFLLSTLKPSMAADTLRPSESIGDDGTTLVSKDETFELGFFSPGTSIKRYLGIWYKNIPVQTVVWVANRLNPINDSSVTLTMTTSGNLVLSQNNTVLWSTNSTAKAESPTARLLDSGNLVVIDEDGADPDAYLWQSFDYPSDTLLPGMKYGWDLKTGWQWYLTAWKSPDDPSPGDLTSVEVLHGYPDSYLMKGNKRFYRFGPWNGVHGSGGPEIKPNPVFQYTFVNSKDGIYYMDIWNNNSVLTRLVLNQTESARYRYVWLETTKTWQVYSTKPVDYCDTYGLCGPNGNCIISESPVCQCLKGFTPMSPRNWNSVDWADGCVRQKPLNCSEKEKDGFIKMTGMKVPDTTHSWLDETMNLEQCRLKCLENCSCTAYADSDIRGEGSGCALWFGDLTDIRYYASGGQDLYVRMDASELESGNKKMLTMIVTITIGAIFGMLVGGCVIYRVRRNRIAKSKDVRDDIQYNEGPEDDLDLPLFDLATIASATDDFSNKNKIGEGGFGPVYWGKLLNGQEIAVKRLSIKSRQGLVEFKNEVKFIAKLQHRNLVKLLGCCIHEQEKMLVYEYMSNRSLDSFIFDEIERKRLNWFERFNIILGIGRGLIYLHQDSRLKIIHRDLKASNILLDDKLIPKISDFGLAKTFGEEQTEGNTNKIVGTYGYMAPEYAADGLYSVKSDVFSYGILVLEIICGKKNRGFYLEDSKHNLIGYAWILWTEGRVLELIDQNTEETCNVSSILRSIHVSLLCVQQRPEDRPTIASAVLMLESEVELAEPKQPGFFHGKDSAEPHQKQCSSTNEVTMSLLEAR